MRQRRGWVAGLGAAVVLAGVLFAFPPERYGWYPGCPVRAWTGLLCPGCGGTRAAAALVHGRWGMAWRANALVTVLLPMVMGYGWVRAMRPGWRGEVPGWVAWGMLGVAVGFGVWRNVG